MIKPGKKLLALALMALVVIGTWAGCKGSPYNEPASALGTLAKFSAQGLDGESFTEKDLAAKDLTVINFWTTQCGPCVEEMSDLAKFEQALPNNVRFLTVCLDGKESADEVQKLLAKAGYEGLTLTTGDGDFKAICDKVQATPTTVLVGPDGQFVGTVILGSKEDYSGTVLKAINKALADAGKSEIALAE